MSRVYFSNWIKGSLQVSYADVRALRSIVDQINAEQSYGSPRWRGTRLEHSHPMSLLPRGPRDTSDRYGTVAVHDGKMYQTLNPGGIIVEL